MQMFRAKCVACATVFDVIATPVTVDVFVRVARGASCPMCGNRQGNTCAPARDLTDAERAQRSGANPPVPASAQETTP